MVKIKKAILPVAGLGTRFLPATKAQPKEMLPLVDKPVIQFLVEEAVNSGIEEIIFVTGRHKRAIEDHFDHISELDHVLRKNGKDEVAEQIRSIAELANFVYVRQKEPRGPGDAILAARHLIGDEPFAILYGDDVVMAEPPFLKQMINVFERYEAPVMALREVPAKDVERWGIAAGKKIGERLWRINDLVEKPSREKAPSRHAIIAKFIVTPDIFPALEKSPLVKGELFLTDALKTVGAARGLYGYEITEPYYDCGSKLGFLQAITEYALGHPEVGKDFRRYLKGLRL